MKMDMEDELRDGIRQLLEKKKITDENDKNPQIPLIRDFIVQELVHQQAYIAAMPDERKRD